MRLTKKQFERFRPLNNWVLIKPNRGEDEIVLNKGEHNEMKFYIDFRFDPTKHAPTVGEVVRVPEKLYYSRSNSNSTEWLTDMELREGDTVLYSYLSASIALGMEQNTYGHTYEDKRIVTVEGDDNIYILVKYDKIYVAKRNEDVIPVNGYMLIEPLERKSIDTFLHLPDIVKEANKDSSMYGVVRYKGSRIEEYRGRPMYKDPQDRALKVPI